jgi:hypothetical protein
MAQADDITIMAIDYRGSGPSPPETTPETALAGTVHIPKLNDASISSHGTEK